MNLSGLVAVSGKPGLFKIIGQSKAGFILQNLEEMSSRIVVNANARLAALDETTVYGIDEDIALKSILLKMQQQIKVHALPGVKAENKELRSYFAELVPDHDQDRVYPSDIKKIIGWFRILEFLPLFIEEDPKDKKEIVEENASAHVLPETPTADQPKPKGKTEEKKVKATSKSSNDAELTASPAGTGTNSKLPPKDGNKANQKAHATSKKA